MAIVAGIDEAGLGPTLGPLVVSWTAFEVPDDHRHGELWRALQPTVTQNPKTKRRLLVADSKKAYSSQTGIGVLEETVLSFAGLAHGMFPHAGAFLAGIAGDDADDALAYPWYQEQQMLLPLSGRALGLDGRVGKLRAACDRAGMRFLGSRSLPVFEAAFNRRVDRTGNKHDVICGITTSLIAELVERFGRDDLVIFVDKQGGRDFYAKLLAERFRGAAVATREHGRGHSHYGLRGNGWKCEVHFYMYGERHALPIALSSMFSKYVRELYMEMFNAFWRLHLPELKRTAGYYADARRFLDDIAPARKALNIPDDTLIRKR